MKSGSGRATPMTREQLTHVRKTCVGAVVYFMRLETHLLETGHDTRHAYLRRVRETLAALRAIDVASSYAMGDTTLVKDSLCEEEY